MLLSIAKPHNVAFGQYAGRLSLPIDRHNAALMPVNHLSQRKPAKPRVSELLGVVLALSARTRRMIMPKVEIDLDVFAPGGIRAVRIVLPE